MILQGRYVALRPLLVTDACMTQRWRTSGRAYLLNKGAQSSAEQARWIASRPDDELNFIMRLDTGKDVGMLSLVNIDLVHQRAEPAHFLIGEPDLVKPYGTGAIAAEAELLLFTYAFDVLKLHRLDGTMASENEGMVAWNHLIGFREEGRRKDYYWLNGHWQDCVVIGLSEDDFRTKTIKRLRSFMEAGNAHE